MVVVQSDQSVHLQAWRALLRAHAGLTIQLERELVEAEGLPLAWYEVLLALDQAPEGAVRLQHLMSTVLMTKSGVTRLVDRMETAGLVSRSGCPNDRRGAYAVLTDRGREKLHRAIPVHVEGIDRHLASVIDAEEASRLRDALLAVADALGGEGALLVPAGECAEGAGECTEGATECAEAAAGLGGSAPEALADPTETAGHPSRAGEHGAESPTMAPRGRTDRD